MSIFTSGTQAIQGRTVNHDPMPWCDRTGITRYSYPFATRDVGFRHDPRPEFAVLDNPILAEIRDLQAQPWHDKSGLWEHDIYARYLRYANDPIANRDGDPLWTEEQRTHARRVLSKLVALS